MIDERFFIIFWNFKSPEQKPLKSLKQTFIAYCVLAHFNSDRQIKMESDCLDNVIAAVLSHKHYDEMLRQVPFLLNKMFLGNLIIRYMIKSIELL